MRLRSLGVVRATFHPDGSLASVEFSPPVDTSQSETPKPERVVMRAVGGLVPRGVDG